MNERQDIDIKIGEAWKAHYDGQQQVAIERFEELLQEVPEHIDAHWGLGLSYRNAGDKARALEAFRRVKELIAAQLELEAGEPGRYFMLNRMATQQIDQIEAFLRQNSDARGE